VADLHGNVAAQCSGGVITDAFRYDAYGKAIGTSLTGTIASPWRYQGRILESTGTSGANAEVYDAGARSYVPDLGTFTSLDSVSGSAQNPLSLNRYLYANANPETLVDPDGHRVMYDYDTGIGDQVAAAQTRASDDNSDWSYGNFHSTASDAIGKSLANDAASVFATANNAAEYQFGNHKVLSATNAAAAGTRKVATRWTNEDHDATRRAAANDSAQHECNNPACTLTNVAGAAWNVVSMPVMFAGALGLCAAGGAETFGVGCLPLAGMLAYTGANAGNNMINGNLDKGNYNLIDGWRWQDAAITAASVTTMGKLPGGVRWAVGAGAVAGSAQDLATQAGRDPSHINAWHAVCSGITGAMSGALTNKLHMPADGTTDSPSLNGIVWDAYNTVLGGKLCDTYAK
jgi:RHS repeat-associated protein